MRYSDTSENAAVGDGADSFVDTSAVVSAPAITSPDGELAQAEIKKMKKPTRITRMNTLSSRFPECVQDSEIRLIPHVFTLPWYTRGGISRQCLVIQSRHSFFSTTGAIPMDFLHCYRILGLTAECDWEHARHRYQQLVSRHHPDRPAASADGQSLTEINRAWRQLRKYYQQHGRMPLQTTEASPASRPVTPFAPSPTHPGTRYWSLGLITLAIAAGLLTLMPDRTFPPHQPDQQSAPSAAPMLPAIEAGQPTTAATIKHGDPLGYVVETLGPPHDTRGSRWYYDDSWIELRDGRVSDWYSSADHPLPTDTLSHHHRQR